MKTKCEICGETDGLTEVFVFACDEDSPSATLCVDCKKKYFDGNFRLGWRDYPGLSFAENLVVKHEMNCGKGSFDALIDMYKRRANKHITTSEKEETKMEVSYNGFTGELLSIVLDSSIDERLYELAIYDHQKKVKHTFDNVRIKDVKFLGGTVTFE